MSTQPPPTSAERLLAGQRAVASAPQQLTVLGLGIVGAGVVAGVLGSVSATTNPIWVLPVIVSGTFCFIGLLATTAWTIRSRIGQTPRPAVGVGPYLICLLVTGGVVAFAGDAPPLASAIQRWVSVPATQVPGRPISVGDEVDLWFDPGSPGDARRIVVAHDNGASRLAPGRVGTGAKR